MGYLICSKCKSYYQLESGKSRKDFVDKCSCGSKLRYVENLDIVGPEWRPVTLEKKPSTKENLKKKIQSISSIPSNLKNRLARFKNNFLYQMQNQRSWNQGPQNMNINSLLNELNFHHINWPLIIPFIVTITVIYAFTPTIFSLLILVLLVLVGYLSADLIRAIKNALITGAISLFIGSLLNTSFLFMIPLTIVGAINGAVCGWIGAYLRYRFGWVNNFFN